jgi:hypothetical protein
VGFGGKWMEKLHPGKRRKKEGENAINRVAIFLHQFLDQFASVFVHKFVSVFC